jgi:hypothetical protein
MDVLAENMYNYDETNLQDDPKCKKCFFIKGSKYCERVMNTTKQAISVMFCGSAKGKMVPPKVVYKALNLYSSWCPRGPKGTVFACSKSGWFDGFLFERWFFLPPPTNPEAADRQKTHIGRQPLLPHLSGRQ